MDFFRDIKFRPLGGRPLKFLHALEILLGLLEHTLIGDGSFLTNVKGEH